MISSQQPHAEPEIAPKRVTIDDIIPLGENVAIQYSANKEEPALDTADKALKKDLTENLNIKEIETK